MSRVTRRAALTILGASATTVGLAACAPAGSEPGSGGGIEATKDASGGASVAASDVPVGGSVIVQTGSGSDPAVALAQPTAGEYVGHTAICTHQGCVVAAAGAQLHCPCHGSRYDAFTGKVLQGPARLPLDAVKVTVSGDSVEFTV